MKWKRNYQLLKNTKSIYISAIWRNCFNASKNNLDIMITIKEAIFSILSIISNVCFVINSITSLYISLNRFISFFKWSDSLWIKLQIKNKSGVTCKINQE